MKKFRATQPGTFLNSTVFTCIYLKVENYQKDEGYVGHFGSPFLSIIVSICLQYKSFLSPIETSEHLKQFDTTGFPKNTSSTFLYN